MTAKRGCSGASTCNFEEINVEPTSASCIFIATFLMGQLELNQEKSRKIGAYMTHWDKKRSWLLMVSDG
jgi:hypothetical protein